MQLTCDTQNTKWRAIPLVETIQMLLATGYKERVITDVATTAQLLAWRVKKFM